MPDRSAGGGRLRRAAGLLVAFVALGRASAYEELFPAPGASRPRIAVAEGGVGAWLVAWEQRDGSQRRVMLTASDDGKAFFPPKPLPAASAEAEAGAPAVAVDGQGRAHLVWVEARRGVSSVRYARSSDRARTFSLPVTLSAEKQNGFQPAVAVDSRGRIFVVWAGSGPGGPEIYFARSLDGGNTFSEPRNLSDNRFLSERPAIAVDAEGTVYVVWRDREPPTYQIWMTRSTDAGESFSPRKVVSRTGFSDAPAVAAEGKGTVYVAWSSNVTGNRDVFFVRSLDRGESFGPLLNLTGNRLPSDAPALAADGEGNVYVAWADRTPGRYEILFRHSPDRGESFYPIVSLTPSLAAARAPSIAALRGAGIFGVWEGSRDGREGIVFVDQEEIVRAPRVP